MPEDKELGAGKTAFIISPIGDKMEAIGTEPKARWEEGVQIWENVFKPACARFGLEAVRADTIAAPGEIPEQIFLLLRDADVVIADLSGANPNVMYELGLRHSRDKIAIQVGETGRLPFDVNTVRTTKFRRTEAGLIDLRNSLEDTLRAALLGHGTPTAATRVWSDAAPVDAAAVAAAAASSALPDDPTEVVEEPLIDMLAAGEAGLTDVSAALTDALASIQLMGGLSEDATAKLHASDAAGKGFAGRLLVTRQLAKDLEEPVATYETEIERYYGSLQAADAMTRYVLRRIIEDAEQRTDETANYLNNLDELIDAAEGSEKSISDYVRSASSWKKLSKDLTVPAKVIERAGHRMIEGIAMISGWRQPVADARVSLDGGTD